MRILFTVINLGPASTIHHHYHFSSSVSSAGCYRGGGAGKILAREDPLELGVPDISSACFLGGDCELVRRGEANYLVVSLDLPHATDLWR
uniref:Uncharacterized protein n=1 Tax=Salix viminalis TaxID=40686 RepID=A0A6N2MH26_SALVM